MSDVPPDSGAGFPAPASPSAAARRGGLRALAVMLPKVTRAALRRRGFAEGALAAEWPAIVGTEIAARCLPKKLALARPGRRAEGVLTLRVEAGYGIELQHLAPLVLERVNGYFGYRAIDRLRLQQGPIRPAPGGGPPPRPLGAAEEAELQRRLSGISDEALRGALERLGRALQGRARP